MDVEKSVAIIVFRKEADFRFLLLWKKASEHAEKSEIFGTPKTHGGFGGYREAWEFPKGNGEKGESEMQTALRELKEETGLDEKDVQFYDFHDKVSFFYRKEDQELIRKEVSFLMARTTRSEVKISSEHDAFRWAPYLEAFDLLNQKNNKEILRKAYDFAKKRLMQKTIF